MPKAQERFVDLFCSPFDVVANSSASSRWSLFYLNPILPKQEYVIKWPLAGQHSYRLNLTWSNGLKVSARDHWSIAPVFQAYWLSYNVQFERLPVRRWACYWTTPLCPWPGTRKYNWVSTPILGLQSVEDLANASLKSGNGLVEQSGLPDMILPHHRKTHRIETDRPCTFGAIL